MFYQLLTYWKPLIALSFENAKLKWLNEQASGGKPGERSRRSKPILRGTKL